MITMLPNRGKLISAINTGERDIHCVTIKWENVSCVIKVLGNLSANISIHLYGTRTFLNLHFQDTFFAFKKSLQHFVDVVLKRKENIPSSETLEVISIIELGRQ